MAKDWRTAICTRYRLGIELLLASMLFVGFTLAMVVIDNYPANRLSRKAELLPVGMTEQELVRIMGTPLSRRNLSPDAMDGILTGAKGDSGHLGGKYKQLVEYSFISKRLLQSRLETTEVRGIYLDQEQDKIVLVQPRLVWTTHIRLGELWFDPELLVLLLLLGASIVLTLISVRTWCKRKLGKTGV